MLKKHSQFFANLLFFLDLTVICIAWLTAYGLLSSGWPLPVYGGIPPLKDYLFFLIFTPPIWGIIFKGMRMYRPRRISSRLTEVYEVLKAATFTVLLLMAVVYSGKKFELSRAFFVYLWVLSSAGLIATRLLFREFLRYTRRRGYNLRHILILGTDRLGRMLQQQIGHHPELGLNIVGFLTYNAYEVGQWLDGIMVLGHIGQAQAIVRQRHIDQVFITLPLETMPALEKILRQLGNEMVDIKILPDLYQYVILQGSIEEFEGLPIVTLSDSPMYGWNRVVKRAFDLAVCIPVLLVCLPLLGLISLVIKATSRGPVFCLQDRMGYDGKIIRMMKFRTMYMDAEQDAGDVSTHVNDPRRTWIGSVLRHVSFDELPLLWNVLKGEMSLVGPHPERPVLVEECRHRLPRYMLRHRVKAGVTGWAQVRDWRGDTSLEQRLEHDLYYIQHWSLLLDLKILWLTLWRRFVHKKVY